MSIIQLDPPLPISCPKGEGLALFLTDYGCEFNHIWTIAIDETGEIWSYPNPQVRMQKNITMNRLLKDPKNEKERTKKASKENERNENGKEKGNVPCFPKSY
jgi:hypothetical protein